jgi:hypothetical protein
MEDVWVTGDFEQYWSHPLNEGWMNYFHRWTSTPSFRRWWPVVAPMYSIGLRSFVQDRFSVRTIDAATDRPDRPMPRAAWFLFTPLDPQSPAHQSAHAWRCFLQRHPNVDPLPAGNRIFGCALHLPGRDGAEDRVPLWVGFVLVTESTRDDHRVAEWQDGDFFVPPMLHGSKIVSNLLDALIAYYQSAEGRPVNLLQVNFGEPAAGAAARPRRSQGLAPAARYERVREIEFYKSRGFHYLRQEDAATGTISLRLEVER